MNLHTNTCNKLCPKESSDMVTFEGKQSSCSILIKQVESPSANSVYIANYISLMYVIMWTPTHTHTLTTHKSVFPHFLDQY